MKTEGLGVKSEHDPDAEASRAELMAKATIKKAAEQDFTMDEIHDLLRNMTYFVDKLKSKFTSAKVTARETALYRATNEFEKTYDYTVRRFV